MNTLNIVKHKYSKARRFLSENFQNKSTGFRMEIGGEVWSLNEITQKYNHSNYGGNGIGFCSLSTVTHALKHTFGVSSRSVKPLFFLDLLNSVNMPQSKGYSLPRAECLLNAETLIPLFTLFRLLASVRQAAGCRLQNFSLLVIKYL